MTRKFVFLLFCALCWQSAFSQSSDMAMGILPIEYAPGLDGDMAKIIEMRLMEKVATQKRFKIIDEREGGFANLLPTAAEFAEAGKNAGATHLVQFKLLPLTLVQKPPEAKDFSKEISLHIESKVDIEIKVYDVATGEVVESKMLGGKGIEMEQIPPISPTELVWSKEKGMHNQKKTEKQLKKDYQGKLKRVADLRKSSKDKAINSAVEKASKKFLRLFSPEINIAKITSSKKGKAKELILTAGEDLGLTDNEKLDVYLVSELDFMGEKQLREQDIGTLKFEGLVDDKPYCKVMSGKEEIFAAFEKGDKLICKIHEK